jgi:hypothetical protein
MFGLQRQLLLTFFAARSGELFDATLPEGAINELERYDAEHDSNNKNNKSNKS